MMIKILIADDSITETALLKHIFEAEQDMCVIGCAKNGKEAAELAVRLKPDLITMDIQMPLMDGLEATKLIMMTYPVPIVVISSTINDKSLNTAFLALEAGAVSVMDKPVNVIDPSFKYVRKRIIDLLRGMAEIKVVKRRFPAKSHFNITHSCHLEFRRPDYEILAIGASVGGPEALKIILSGLPADFPIPIVIVQHITLGFIEGFCKWLDGHCTLKVKCVENHERLVAGTVYFAPENYHFQIKRTDKYLVAALYQGKPVSGFYPSISVLFQSVAASCGQHAIGLLLTGMGSDGAQGLLDLKQKKAHTIIQDAASSVVFGMARVAQSLDAVDKIIELDKIAKYLELLTHELR